jgi:hypothetical protein
MKPLSETYKELGIAFSFPIEIKDDKGSVYYESSNGLWHMYKHDAKGYQTYFENSAGCWQRWEHDANGNVTYYEDGDGLKEGTPKSSKTCEGKVVEVDGIKYELKAL